MKELARHIMVDFLPMKEFAENPLILTEGQGIHVIDVDGRRFIDGLSGTFCVNLGHGNKRLAEAASRQIERLALAAPTLGTSDRALELVKLLLEITPPQYTTVKLSSGGSEVTEAAIKMARQYHKQVGHGTKYKILSHYRAYHGAPATPWPPAAGRAGACRTSRFPPGSSTSTPRIRTARRSPAAPTRSAPRTRGSWKRSSSSRAPRRSRASLPSPS